MVQGPAALASPSSPAPLQAQGQNLWDGAQEASWALQLCLGVRNAEDANVTHTAPWGPCKAELIGAVVGLFPDWTFPADPQVTPGLPARDRARSSRVAERSGHDGKTPPQGRETKEHESEGEPISLLTQDGPLRGAEQGWGWGWGASPQALVGAGWVFLTLRSVTAVSPH